MVMNMPNIATKALKMKSTLKKNEQYSKNAISPGNPIKANKELDDRVLRPTLREIIKPIDSTEKKQAISVNTSINIDGINIILTQLYKF